MRFEEVGPHHTPQLPAIDLFIHKPHTNMVLVYSE